MKASKTGEHKIVEICGHHVFNIIWAHGMKKEHLGDESNAFTRVFRQVMDNPSVEVKVLIGVDDICRPCKYNVDGRCQAYDGTIPDRKAIRKLGLKAGEVRKWNELVQLAAERVESEEDFLEIFSQGMLETRFSYFKKGIERLSQNPHGGVQRPAKLERSNGFGTCSKKLSNAPKEVVNEML